MNTEWDNHKLAGHKLRILEDSESLSKTIDNFKISGHKMLLMGNLFLQFQWMKMSRISSNVTHLDAFLMMSMMSTDQQMC